MTINEATMIRFSRFHAERRVALANEATRRGVRIVLIDRTSRHIAVEPNSPTAYAVDVEQCTCKRFRLWGCCDHHALLQSELGYGAAPDDIGWPEDHLAQQETIPAYVWDQRPSGMAAD